MGKRPEAYSFQKPFGNRGIKDFTAFKFGYLSDKAFDSASPIKIPYAWCPGGSRWTSS
jgi:hypothetical protein